MYVGEINVGIVVGVRDCLGHSYITSDEGDRFKHFAIK